MKKPKVNDVFKYHFSFKDEDIIAFSKISGDVNPIHISDIYSKNSIFGKCIVHGYFSISIFSKVYGTELYPDQHILISQNAKYYKPIYTGIEYTAVFIVKELFPDKNRVLYLNEIYEKESGELKVSGEALLMNKKFYTW